MYHLLIKRVSTVMIEFLQYRARVRIELNRAGIERVVERTDLFTSLPMYGDLPQLFLSMEIVIMCRLLMLSVVILGFLQFNPNSMLCQLFLNSKSWSNAY
jgi:hypothetical protein